ncbi:cold-regulated 413 inner membrane protein 1, chloroplastic-like, partial [Andrographis paniculata]|uniref:cold-regulated 413 inner membrane protein 1, chloroplastic-like n=1 Tax=Andrographis paniculata TaxID=175694 RepID=UPI0021E7B914
IIKGFIYSIGIGVVTGKAILTMSISVSCSSLYSSKHLCKSPSSHQYRAFCHASPQLQQFHRKQQLNFSSLVYNPFRSLVMNKRRRGVGAVCYSAPFTYRNLQWVSTVCTTALMLARGTAIHKSFLVPFFVLQAPPSIVTWMKGEYGIWTAFLALLVRLFFVIPGELELPFITLLLVIVSPYQIMRLRGTQEGVIISLAISAYLAFQHFTRAGSLQRALDQGSILATLATICIVVVPCLHLL